MTSDVCVPGFGMFWLLCNVGVGDFPDAGTPNADLEDLPVTSKLLCLPTKAYPFMELRNRRPSSLWL